MAKRVAVLAVDPVNGCGLFQYLESFFENDIAYKVFAVAPGHDIRTNSGIALRVDGTVADLQGHEAEFDAVVFSCGDAVPKFGEHAAEPHNVALMEVLRAFAAQGSLVAGHCGAALIFDLAGIAGGRRVAVHPLAKPAVQHAAATDAPAEIDGNFYTAQDEKTLWQLMPRLVEALK